MKYIYVVAERNPYRAYVKEAESGTSLGHIAQAFTADKILELMGDMTVLNAVYEILIKDGTMHPGDILAPERSQ